MSAAPLPEKHDELRVSLVQSNLVWQDASSNLTILDSLLAPLSGQTDLVILPEMFTSAFTMQTGAIAESHPGPTLSWMQAQAAQLNAAITGSIAVISNNKRTNRLYFVSPDGAVRHYDKRHLFRMLGEDKRYAPGTQKLILEYRGWRIFPQVCYDLRFPVWCRTTPQAPYDLMIVVANWPAPRRLHWSTLLQARAIENQSYVAGVNRIGTDGNKLNYSGDSAIYDPLGEKVCDAGNTASVSTCTLSLIKVEQWREQFPAWCDADTFTLAD